ncbi:hypothetical protein SIN8267_00559 [Sinobacterium norvegicum]|uniref:Tetratricopeptide repeat protein n=1 Tax=Sinobacterium norvegicum TaxID=1641715 RepID=A0ABM9AC53_9GAMM|nr:hypothetical protein [Sinobacterium norvegicum]CAH0990467.1 hypothetical protein SIN8267_00559 [Sinobacterium norvegicum]
MNIIKVFSLAVIMLVLQGCQMPGHLDEDVLQLRVDDLLANQKYQRAIDLVAKQQPQTAKLEQQHRRLVDGAEHYRRSLAAQVNGLAKNSRWVEAEALMSQGVNNYPSEEMRSQYDSIILRREAYLEKHWRQLNYQRASVIPDNIAEVNKLLAAQPGDKQAQNLSKQYAQESLELLKFVVETAEMNEGRGRYTAAKADYQLAKLLSLDKQYGDEMRRLDGKLLALQQAKKKQKQQSLLKQKQKLEAQFLASIASGELQAAEKQLANIAALGIDSQRLQGYREVLDEKVARAVSILVMKANTAYTLGEIEAAIADWQQALVLQPNNSVVVEKLARAKAFKNYYESLQGDKLTSE